MKLKEKQQLLQRVLLSEAPQRIVEILKSSPVEGLCIDTPVDFSVLEKVPCAMLPRWWAFLHLAKGDAAAVCRELKFSDIFQKKLKQAEFLFALPISESERAFRQKIARMKQDEILVYGELLETFILLDADWMKEKVWFSRLQKQGILEQDFLRVTVPTLRAEGIPAEKTAKIMKELHFAVIKEPSLNRPERLMQMAKLLYCGGLL